MLDKIHLKKKNILAKIKLNYDILQVEEENDMKYKGSIKKD